VATAASITPRSPNACRRSSASMWSMAAT
jgi:hypothetical protein